MQRRWLREFGSGDWRIARPHDVMVAQVRAYRPDVLVLLEMSLFDDRFLRRLKEHVGLIVGQIACPMPAERDYSGYDLVLSSLPNYVEHFRRRGKAAELFRLGFEASILEQIEIARRDGPPLVHVGGFGPIHDKRNVLLERLCRRFDLKVWGYGVEHLPADSTIRRCYQGQAWGIDQYRIVAAARIVPNMHIRAVAGDYANNCRLFEVTGVGTLLITDRKRNLHEMFDVGREVVAYDDADDCEAKIAHYLEHPAEADAIARAGQRRTLRDHTYARRMEELAAIAERYAGRSRRAMCVGVAK